MNKKLIIIFQSLVLFLIVASFILTNIFILKLIPKSNVEIDKNVETNNDEFYSSVKKTFVSMIVPDTTNFTSNTEIKKINSPQFKTIEVDSQYTLKIGVNSYINKGDIIASNSDNEIKSNYIGRVINIQDNNGTNIIYIDLITNYYLKVEVPIYYFKTVNFLNESKNKQISISIGNYVSKATIFSCIINDKSNYELIINNFDFNPNVYEGFKSNVTINYITKNYLAFPKECIIKRLNSDLILAKKIILQSNEPKIEEVTLKLANNYLILQEDIDYSEYSFVEEPLKNQGYYITISSNF